MVHALLGAGARVIAPDMRGFGASDKPLQQSAYENNAMAWDAVELVRHLCLGSVDVIGFSMGTGTGAGILLLQAPEVKSAILAGVGKRVVLSSAPHGL